MEQQVFSNPLVWETLAKCLKVQDLLSLRKVSRIFCERVTNCKIFQDRIYLRVFWNLSRNDFTCPCTIYSPNLKIMLMFENKAIPGYESISLESKLKDIKAIKLTLLLQDGSLSNSTFRVKIQSSVMQLLNEIPNLESFSVNRLLLSVIDLDSASVKNSLKEIVLYSPPSKKSSSVLSGTANVQRNIHTLASNVSNLSKFLFDKFPLPSQSSAKDVWSIVEKSEGTLKTLELVQEDVWKSCPESVLKNFPFLKRLKLRAEFGSGIHVSKFINAQNPLEVLSISFKDKFPQEVYTSLCSKSGEMRVLHVKGKSFGGNGIPSWDFLKGAKYMEDFQMKVPYSSNSLLSLGDYNVIPKNLGPNLTRLYLRGLSGSGTVSLQNWQFPALAELSLLRCRGSFDDNTLRYIAGNFPRLTTFEFSCCPGVTNNGIAELFKIKALRKLTMKELPNITDGALNRLYLNELKSLDISSNQKVQRAGIQRVVLNNPKLEFLRSSWRVGREVASVCGSNRFVKLDYVDDKSGKEPNDSDSDADRQLYYDSDEDHNYGYDDDSDF